MYECCLKVEENDVCCFDIDFLFRVCFSGDRIKGIIFFRYLYSLSREKEFIFCLLI